MNTCKDKTLGVIFIFSSLLFAISFYPALKKVRAVAVAVVRAMAHDLDVPSLNPPGLLIFFNQRQNVLHQVPQERCIFAVFPLITLAVLPEAKQAYIHTE